MILIHRALLPVASVARFRATHRRQPPPGLCISWILLASNTEWLPFFPWKCKKKENESEAPLGVWDSHDPVGPQPIRPSVRGIFQHIPERGAIAFREPNTYNKPFCKSVPFSFIPSSSFAVVWSLNVLLSAEWYHGLTIYLLKDYLRLVLCLLLWMDVIYQFLNSVPT